MVFEIQELFFTYGTHLAINNLSLSLAPGRFYSIIGPNGCGKTTLMDLMCRHKKPDSGTILLNGRFLDGYSSRALARQVALVPQEYQVNFPYTAKEVISMARYPYLPRFSAPTAKDIECVNTALSACRAEALADRFMTGLSGGEKQRVIFARALAQQTPVLLLDEPCANLDIHHALLLLELARKRVKNHGATVVAVMHDINLALRYADELIIMKQGAVTAFGVPEKILECGILKQIFGVDARIRREPAINASQVTFLKYE